MIPNVCDSHSLGDVCDSNIVYVIAIKIEGCGCSAITRLSITSKAIVVSTMKANYTNFT
jgi:hypothetical protein